MKTVIYILSFFTILITSSCASEDFVSPQTNSVASSPDVYVAGTQANNAYYWKNGIPIMLTNGTDIVPIKIIVDNNNVYVLGKKYISYSISEYYFWKNNVKYELENYLGIPATSVSHFHDFTVKDNIEIFGGRVDDSGSGNSQSFDICYWKNGVKTILQSNTFFFEPMSVFYHNNSVYTNASNPKGYFKDNIFQNLNAEFTLNFAVKNNDVYFLFINNSNSDLNYYNTSNQSLAFSNLDAGYANFGYAQIIADSSTNDLYTFSPDHFHFSNKYYKNNTAILLTNDISYDKIVDMKVHNGITYIIRGKTNPPYGNVDGYKVYIDNSETQTTSTGVFSSIYVVNN